MKKILFIIGIFILSLVCLCGCSSTSNKSTEGQVVVKKTYNDKINRYDLTPVYLKIDGVYVYIQAWYRDGLIQQQLSTTSSSSQANARTACSELVQYDNYFEITLAVYIRLPNSDIPVLSQKKLSVSNNLGGYKIEK